MTSSAGGRTSYRMEHSAMSYLPALKRIDLRVAPGDVSSFVVDMTSRLKLYIITDFVSRNSSGLAACTPNGVKVSQGSGKDELRQSEAETPIGRIPAN